MLFSRFTRRATIAAIAIATLVPLSAVIPSSAASAADLTVSPDTTVVDDTSASIVYTGTWRTTGSPSDQGSSVHFASSTASASMPFTGSTVTYIGRQTSSSGISEIIIDGKVVATVNGYSATTNYQKNFFSTSTLSSGDHTITVKRTGKKDALSSGTNTIIDAFLTRTPATVAEAPTRFTTIDSESPEITYVGTWRTTGSVNDTGGSIKFTSNAGSASHTFQGSSLAVISRLTSSSGISSISIDGAVVATINGYSASTVYKKTVYTTDNLSAGTHTVTVTRTGQKDDRSTGTNTIIDAFIIAALPSTAPTPAAIKAYRYADCPAATVTVSNAKELMAAMAQAKPGTVVKMAPGTYSEQINLVANGTADAPIWVCGPRTAIVNVGSIQDNHGIQITNSSNLVIAGMTVTNSLKGISVIRSNNVTIADTLVDNIGYEGIHLRAFTTDSTVVGNTIRNTGKRDPFYGEGIYIGTSENNWCAQTNCLPDHTDRNNLMDNSISLTSAQPIEVKEGTSNGVIRNNFIDGSNALSRADEWVKVKGNDWQIYNNTGSNSSLHGFAVNGSVTGWGLRNIFFGNTGPVNAAGYGFFIYEQGDRGASGTKVYCSNTVTAAGAGFSNRACIS